MRSINDAVLAYLEKRAFTTAHLLEMTVDSTTYRYTDADVPIEYAGNLYSPKPFEVRPVSYSAGTIVNRATVEVKNLDQAMSGLFVGSVVQGSQVVIKKVVLHSDWHVLGQLYRGCIGSWSFNEESGSTAADSSGNGNDGTVYGATWVDGVSGNGLSFDGTDDYVDLPNVSDLKPTTGLTLSLWFKADVVPPSSSSYLFLCGRDTSSGYMLQTTTTGTVRCALWGSSDSTSAYKTISQDTLYHAAMTYESGSGGHLYLDGDQVGTLSDVGDIVYVEDYGSSPTIGCHGGIYFFDGLIDEVRIYNRALAQDEITLLYEYPGSDVSGGAVTIFEGSVDSWRLDEENLSMDITSILTRWSQRTTSRHPSYCRWKKFKGTECGYAGASTWCDRTYARCLTLGNTANFGGHRWLPWIIDKEIWWGRTQG